MGLFHSTPKHNKIYPEIYTINNKLNNIEINSVEVRMIKNKNRIIRLSSIQPLYQDYFDTKIVK
jgi:hypothetical protein